MGDVAGIVAVAAGVAAVVSAGASLFSARNSGRSASAAERSANASVTALHRAAVRELVMLAHETLAEEARIRSLAIDLGAKHTKTFNTAGNLGSSRHVLAQEALAKDLAKAEERSAEARRLIKDTDALYAESTILVSQAAARVVADRDELRVTREAMERHLAS
jgi:hypothetical protein